jgi:hypothetical protein
LQVHPTVALPFVSVRGLLELRGAHERAGNAAVAVAVSITREKLAVLAGCRVVVTAVIQRRVIEHVELVGLARQRREAYVDEYGRAGRICDVGLSDTVLPVYVRVDLLIGKRASAVQESHLVVSSLSLQLGERLAVADDELQVSHAGCPDVWVVDFGELTVVECVPEPCWRSCKRSRSRPCLPRSRCVADLLAPITYERGSGGRKEVVAAEGLR